MLNADALPKVYVSRRDEDSFLLEGCGICGSASLEETEDDLTSMKAVTATGQLGNVIRDMMIGESLTFYVD